MALLPFAMDSTDEAALVEKLYEFGQRLVDPSGPKNESDYLGIISAAKGSSKSKQLAAQLIPRFFKHFPNLSSEAINAQLDLCEEEEFGVSCSFLNWDGFSLLLRRQQISWAVWTRYGQTLCNLQTADLKMIGKSKHNVFI